MYIPDLDNKGYKAAQKLKMKLQGEVYPKMTDEEILEFQKSMIEHLLPMGIKMPEELIKY